MTRKVYILSILIFFIGCGGGGDNSPKTEEINSTISMVDENKSLVTVDDNDKNTTSVIETEEDESNQSVEDNSSIANIEQEDTPPSSQVESNNNELVNSSSVVGKVVDGELIYATVFLDLNKNTLLDEGEPKAKTDENGEYNLTVNSSSKNHENYKNSTAPLVSIGGFDKKSKKEFEGVFTAPFSEDSPNITPITTLLNEILKSDRTKTLKEVKETLASSLGLGVDDLTKDPVEMAQNGNPKLMELALKVHQSSEILSKGLKSDSAETNIYALMAKELKDGSALDKALSNTVDKNSDKFDPNRSQISKDAVEELNSNIDGLFESYKDSFGVDSSLITRIALNLDKTKDKIIDAVNKNDLVIISSIDWKDDIVDDIGVEIIRQLLSMVSYQNESDIQDIAKFNSIDDDLTLKGLRELLRVDGNYAHIINVIDEKLKDLNSDRGLNNSDAPKAIASSLSIKKIRQSDWNSGFCEDIEVKNISDKSITWEVTTIVDGDIDNLWSANYTQNSETKEIIATGLSWNSTLSPNQTTKFGYCAKKTADSHSSESSNDSSNLVVTKTINSDWSSGFCEDVTVSNSENKEIRAWNISTAVDGEVYQVWNALYEQDENFNLIASGLDWNRNIKANSSVEFGYCANKVEAPTNPDKIAIENDKKDLTFDTIRLKNSSIDTINSALNLIKIATNGSNVAWESNSDSISSSGAVTRPASGEADIEIELLATLTKGDFRETKRFNLKVIAQEASDADTVAKDKLNLTFDTIRALNLEEGSITSKLNLIKNGQNGSSITWKSNSTALLVDGTVKRPKYGDGNITVRLTATIIKGSSSESKIFNLILLESDLVEPPPLSGESKYHDVLGMSLKFYEAQRAVGPFPTVDWRKPASTTDGSDVGVDLNGGWFDAGDHVKFNLPMSYSVGMLNWSMINEQEAYTQSGKLDYGKEQVKYALDYLLNTYQSGVDLNSPIDDKIYYQVAEGHTDHTFWGSPEELNMERKTFICDKDGGCGAVAGSMVGAFASGAILFKDDTAYSQQLLDNAKRLHSFAMTYPTDSDYSSDGQDFYKLYSNNKDQRAWGAIWLYKATNDTQYLNQAKDLMQSEYPWGHAWDNMVLGVSLLLVQEGESEYQQRVEDELNAWIDVTGDVKSTIGGLRVKKDIKWGNLRYSASVAYISLMYSDMISDTTKKQRFIDFGKSQIDYMLGDNPNNFSYVVGYGDNYPLRPHHRGASGTTEADLNPNKYVIEGALVGGPMSADDNDYQDIRHGEIGYTANEVATDYNAGFTGALAKLALLYGEMASKTDAEIVQAVKNGLTFDKIKNLNTTESQIVGDLNLRTTGSNGTTISWSSDNTAIINSSGVVTRADNDRSVVLTATITKGGVTDTQTFTLTVAKEEVEVGSCQVNYHIRNQWNSGATIDVTVTNQIGDLHGWSVTFTFPSGQTISGESWDGISTQTGDYLKVDNRDYNAQVTKGNDLKFGFNLNHNGTNDVPTDIRLNDKLCDGQIGGVEKPTAPTDLTSQIINNTKAILSWVDSSNNEDNFVVQRSVDLASFQTIATLDRNITTYEDSGLEAGHSYEYQILAKNIAGETNSNKITVQPSLISVEDGVDNSAVSIISNCATCHIKGGSDSSIPMIHGLDKEYLVKTLKGYRGKEHFSYAMDRVMDGYSDTEIEMMAEYYSSREWIGNSFVSYDVEKINSGKQIFDSNCAVCHGDNGKGKIAKVDISFQSREYLVDTMMQYAKGLHKDAHQGMRDMFINTIGQDSTKIEALATYLAVGVKVLAGDNDTIRGFNAKYLNSSNKIEASWDYINPDTQRVEIMVNGVMVKSITDINSATVIDNDGSSNFVMERTYNISIKAINGDKKSISQEIPVRIMSAEAYGEEYYNAQCKVCHGVNGTKKKNVTTWNPSAHTFAQFTQNSTMPTGYYSGCDTECLDFIGVYVTNVLVPRVKDNKNSVVEDVVSDIPRGYRLLNAIEYTNTLHSLLEIGDDSYREEQIGFIYTDLPKDNIVDGYDTDRDMNRIDEDKVKYLNKKAHNIEVYIKGLEGQSGLSCQINGYNFCTANKDNFLDSYATKIFRRPLSDSEKSTYRGLSGVSEIIADMLVSPNFLYRSEMGVKTNETTSVYQLTQYEIATAISYAMAGTTPDDELLTLARENQLLDVNSRVTEAVRLSKTQTGKDKLDDFIGRWLLEDNIYTLTDKNPDKFPGYTQEVRKSQSNQILKFFRMVMDSTTNSSYRDLLINRNMVTNATISNYYGEGLSSSSSFESVPATTKRYGLLTLGAVASRYANSEESHPFQRGKFVLARLMCHPLGIPGNGGDVPAIKDHHGENKRDRYSEHVNDPSCAACHNLIDPIGFTWEKYDGTGRYRTHENHLEEYGGAKPIDTSVTLRGLLTFDEVDEHNSNGMRDVSEIISNSDRGPECMSLQYYRYISGDTHADIENSKVVKKISSDFKDENYDLQGLFTNIVGLKSFITREGR